MEFGPRALGNRSILGDPRNPELHRKLNVDVKAREAFRPFAPSILEENVHEYFESEPSSPYMLFVSDLKEEHRCSIAAEESTFGMYEWLYLQRSKFPAITHVDYSSRVQTVNQESNPKFWALIKSFKTLTGCPMLVNTSFNVRGEPMVCTPLDAYLAFMNTQIDFLVMGDYLFDKREQQPLKEKYKTKFELD
jgi:carbamoyltransferase